MRERSLILACLIAMCLAAAACSGGSPASTRTPAPSRTAPSGSGQASPPQTPTVTPAARPAAGGYTLSPALPGVNFEAMVDLAIIPGSNGDEAVLITQPGLLYHISLNGAFAPKQYGDLRDRLRYGGEEGLLSLAFSPRFSTDGRLYVYYTTGSPGPSRLSRFHATASSLDPGSEQVLLEVPQPYANHNGGRLLFGPDGYLYLSLGDGGSEGDPQGNGQKLSTLLGKMLRLDVSGASGYTIPPDNPLANGGGRPEIWVYGLRNTWRYSFDRKTGQLWAGDVGQDKWEEVDHIERGGNYGWSCYEGFAPYHTAGCPQSGFQAPRAVYDHSGGNCSITGGYVYRGQSMPELNGWFVYGDYCSGRVWAVNTTDSTDPVLLAETGKRITSFAETADGELLVLTFDRAVYRLSNK